MYLLDTVVVSELRKARTGKANPGVTSWAVGVPAAALYISVVTLHELEVGVARAEHLDPARGAVLRRWVDRTIPASFEGRILPVDTAVARRAASFHVPDPAPFADALIAGTAVVHGLTIVTRNVRDFDRFDGVRLIDPWDGG